MTKRLFVTSLCSILSVFSFAGPDFDTRLNKLEKEMQSVLTSNPSGTYGANLASARPSVDGYGYFLSFDILYWQARVDGTEYAYSNIKVNPVYNYPVNGRIKPVEFDWDFGFRAGVGMNFTHGGWDIYANFTYFTSDGNSSMSSDVGSKVIPIKGDPQIIQPNANSNVLLHSVGRATSQYGLDYDRIDLELGREYYNSYNLSFRPHIGLATTWINQKQTTRYTAGELGINTVQVKDKCDFWGLGPRMGLNSKWYLTSGFSLFGNASASLFYGLFQVQHKNWYTALVNNKVFLRENTHKFSPTAQIQLGLSYDQYLNNNHQHIFVTLGYECQYFWFMNQSLTFNYDYGYNDYLSQNSNLSFNGITLHIKLDF